MNLTTTESDGRTFLVLQVGAAYDFSEFPDGEAGWCAHVHDAASPLAGLYAFGPTLACVRNSIASRAWAEVMAGELETPYELFADKVAGIRVVLTTTSEYDADWLAASVADHAA